MTDVILKDTEYVAGTYARFPLNIVSGKGSIAVDADGKEYIDMGGNGSVWKAELPGDSRPYAIKILNNDASGNREKRARFDHECRFCKNTNNKNPSMPPILGDLLGNLNLSLNFDEDTLLLGAIIYILYRQQADSKLLIALLYVLLF